MECSSLLLDVDESPASAGYVDAVSSDDVPAAADWQAAVETVERMVRCQADLAKVVLARESRVRGRRRFNPVSLLRRLSDDYPDCFIFAVARGEKCFLGASPEPAGSTSRSPVFDHLSRRLYCPWLDPLGRPASGSRTLGQRQGLGRV